MHIKRTRQSKPKLFQCTGFGDCNMVFTRSEHLARHSRKHTGEKPFKCIVADCGKSFSRFDNMMQHTQTHRTTSSKNANGKSASKNGHSNNSHTRSSTRTTGNNNSGISVSQEQKEPKKSCHNSTLTIQTAHSPVYPGLVSPVSFSSRDDLSSDEDEDMIVSPQHHQHQHQHQHQQRGRRLSIAELCNPSVKLDKGMPDVQLTKDEFEALEGFGRFRHTPSVFFDSLRDLALIANIDYC